MLIFGQINYLNLLISFLVLFVIFYWSYRQEALDLKGSVFALIFGIIIWQSQGFYFFLLMLSFFLISYGATQVKSSVKGDLNNKQKTRSVDNVVSNGLVPFISAVVGYEYIFFGSISAALADTLASELGVLSKKKPIMVTNFREVLPGKDGAVSKLGLIVSLFAGVFVSALIFLFKASSVNIFYVVFVLCIAGFIGSLFDSFLGATLEKRGDLSNGSVNFISTLIGGLFALLLKTILVG